MRYLRMNDPFAPIAAIPNVHSRKAPATGANPQVLLLKKWTGTKRTRATARVVVLPAAIFPTTVSC